MAHSSVAMLIAKPQKEPNVAFMPVCLSVLEDVRAACQCDAAQMVVFIALQSEYLLQPTGLADPTVTANGAVGKQTVAMRLYLSDENRFDATRMRLSYTDQVKTFQFSLFWCTFKQLPP